MKERFLELIRQIPDMEKLFHWASSVPGLMTPTEPMIYDKEEFTLWVQEVKYEVQGIIDATDDTYAKETLDALSVRFDSWSDKTKFNVIKGRLLAMERNIDQYYQPRNCESADDKPVKIFVSHSSRDKDQVALIVGLLDDMGLNQTQVFCSSLPGYGIPNDKDIFDFLLLGNISSLTPRKYLFLDVFCTILYTINCSIFTYTTFDYTVTLHEKCDCF